MPAKLVPLNETVQEILFKGHFYIGSQEVKDVLAFHGEATNKRSFVWACRKFKMSVDSSKNYYKSYNNNIGRNVWKELPETGNIVEEFNAQLLVYLNSIVETLKEEVAERELKNGSIKKDLVKFERELEKLNASETTPA